MPEIFDSIRDRLDSVLDTLTRRPRSPWQRGRKAVRPDEGPCLAVWVAVHSYLLEHGYAPTIREIALRSGTTKSQAWLYLRRLQSHGILRVTPSISRGIVLLAQPPVSNDQIQPE